MRQKNEVRLIGNLGQDPDTRFTSGGTAVCNLRIATNYSYKSRSNGEQVQETEWHSVVCFGKQAELCAEYLSKGKPEMVEGRLKTRKWEDRDGVTRYKTEIVANDISFIRQIQENGNSADAPDADLGEQEDTDLP